MKYTKQESNYLQQNYLELTNSELARQLGRSKTSIVNRLHKMQLRRPEGTFQKRGAQYLFKTGSIPWNKNVKGIHISPDTEFKPGHVPANTKHDGIITIRYHKRTGIAYKFIRIAKRKWVTYHSYLWQQKYGKIPKGHIVRFKVGCDTLDVQLENLILVSRKQHARMNHNYEKGSATLQQYWNNGGKGHIASDKYIAFMLASHDDELRNEVINHKEIIELKRMELQLKRTINNNEYNGETC